MERQINNETLLKITMVESEIVIRDIPFSVEVTIPAKPKNNFWFIRHQDKHMDELYWSREN
jgi:hypothetical protein